MFKWTNIVALVATLLLAVGCVAGENGGTTNGNSRYGTLQLGEEQIPINFVQTSDSEDMLLVVLSPLTDQSHLTTNVIIGVKSALLGKELDVEYLYCNDDYIVVYEDPQCYYAPFRPLKSGKITMRKGDDSVGVDVDVVLFDGTPLRYKNEALPLK